MIYKLLIVLVLLNPLLAIAAPTLWLTEQMINLKFNVDNISYQELIAKQSETVQHDTLLFDIRLPEEYQQSRIKGSIQINPDMKSEDFIARYGDKIKNKELIFYCSVGYRSSIFIQRIDKLAKVNGVKKMQNLTGGIFRWYNENQLVINDKGETDEIHPSNESWAHLIKPRKIAPND